VAIGQARGSNRWWIWLLGWSLVVAGCSAEGSVGEPSIDASPSAASPTAVRAEADASEAEADRTNALVTRVVDGDTVEVRFRGRDLDVRLIGVDTPESVAPGEPVGCFAKAAARYTTARLEGEHVRLTFDVERIDRYGRTLAYVWIGEELFNETLVREGYAFVTTYPPNVKHEQRFLRAQRDAREHERGVWGRCVEADTEGVCDPAYPDVCIPPPPPDLDCADITFRRFTVRSPDPHRFDADGNGIGCES
jgi:micrococcal nuclease